MRCKAADSNALLCHRVRGEGRMSKVEERERATERATEGEGDSSSNNVFLEALSWGPATPSDGVDVQREKEETNGGLNVWVIKLGCYGAPTFFPLGRRRVGCDAKQALP